MDTQTTTFGYTDIDCALDILGACILADRLERDEELIELANSAQVLAREIAPECVVSRRDVRDWFERDRDRLKAIAASPEKIREALARLSEPGTRRVALACIYAVCVCDYQLADEESAFIELALEEWAPIKLEAATMAALD